MRHCWGDSAETVEYLASLRELVALVPVSSFSIDLDCLYSSISAILICPQSLSRYLTIVVMLCLTNKIPLLNLSLCALGAISQLLYQYQC